MAERKRIAVHKFTSCDGCQLAFLNAGPALLELAQLADIVHFAEAGPVQPLAPVDLAFVEGSISTPEDVARIKAVRQVSRYLVPIGACATAGGIQALRNLADGDAWLAELYTHPEHVRSLATSTPVSAHVPVDLELWGCPVTTRQVMAAARSVLFGVPPADDADKVCLECKRRHAVCVLVAKGEPCLGPVTRTGCGALCPRFGRDCYGCFGPAENVNTEALGRRFRGLGLVAEEIARRFLVINNDAPAFRDAALHWRGQDDD